MILIIDDDAAVRSSLTFLLKRAGFELEAVPGPEEALVVVRQTTLQLILMDMNFTLTTTGEEGIQLLKQVKVFQPDVPVILMTAWGSISLAVQGMQAGAFDFVTKPWNNLVLLKSIRTAIELSEQKKEQKMPLNRLDADNKFHFDKIIGQSAPLMDVLGTVSRIAPTNASVSALAIAYNKKRIFQSQLLECVHNAFVVNTGMCFKIAVFIIKTDIHQFSSRVRIEIGKNSGSNFVHCLSKQSLKNFTV